MKEKLTKVSLSLSPLKTLKPGNRFNKIKNQTSSGVFSIFAGKISFLSMESKLKSLFHPSKLNG